MLRLTDLRLPFDHAENALERAICERLRLSPGDLIGWRIHRRSVDARKKNAIVLNYTIDLNVRDETGLLAKAAPALKLTRTPEASYAMPPQAPEGLAARPVVIGMGPCGLFAGLVLAQAGFRPILLERGRPARDRARDVTRFWKSGKFDPRSNVAFGEGGAGTFSDGKLTTQIKDREHRCRKVLEELVAAGAPEEILWSAKPHVGTDILIRVVERVRQTIIDLGGEVRFESLVTGLRVESGAVRAVELEGGETIETNSVILAIGHSARDTFAMLHDLGVEIVPKPFSIGVRIEHPQGLIDRAQFGGCAGHPRLGRADYKLVHHCRGGRSVYTFCMCPGGEVIASSSEPGGVVTNGMSTHARNKANANSALLVGVKPEDFGNDHPLAGIEFQRRWEQAAFRIGGENYHAPVQLVGDLLVGRTSKGLGDVKPSYTPGVTPTDLAGCLPDYVIGALREGIGGLDRKLRGFARHDAVLTGVETRSSAPVRILRGEKLESVRMGGLYPAGEGAGYAGGIISAAVDGLRVAEAVARRMITKG